MLLSYVVLFFLSTSLFVWFEGRPGMGRLSGTGMTLNVLAEPEPAKQVRSKTVRAEPCVDLL